MQPFPSLDTLLECALAAARAAGNHALDQQRRKTEVVERFAHDLKLKLDAECQRQAEAVIRRFFPGASILGEEGGVATDDDRPLWIVDPIDGTINFFHGLPLWCASVAVRCAGRMAAGVVYLPVLQETYAATAEGPALLNGQPIHVSAAERLADAVLLTGMNKELGVRQDTFDTLRTVAQPVQKIRMLGAAAVDLCLVARGAAEGYFEAGVYLWDVAAGGLIVERAGGRAEVLAQLEPIRYRYVASNGRLHEPLKELLNRAGFNPAIPSPPRSA